MAAVIVLRLVCVGSCLRLRQKLDTCSLLHSPCLHRIGFNSILWATPDGTMALSLAIILGICGVACLWRQRAGNLYRLYLYTPDAPPCVPVWHPCVATSSWWFYLLSNAPKILLYLVTGLGCISVLIVSAVSTRVVSRVDCPACEYSG